MLPATADAMRSHGVLNDRQLDCLFDSLFWLLKSSTSRITFTDLAFEGSPLADSPHKGPVIRKVSLCQVVNMNVLFTYDQKLTQQKANRVLLCLFRSLIHISFRVTFWHWRSYTMAIVRAIKPLSIYVNKSHELTKSYHINKTKLNT